MSSIFTEGDGLRILSLDGGDLSCISQLIILDDFMKRLQQDTEVSLRPCEYFHLITGVGGSGVIAILLGVLGLSVDETISAFVPLCKAISFGEEYSPKVRSSRLVAATKVLLQKVGVSEDSRLRENPSRGEGCKVSLAYMDAANMTHCRMLRSYGPEDSSRNPTLVEAISIVWANPGVFSPVRVGAERELIQELISAVNGYNNPTLKAVEEAYEAFGPDRRVSCLLNLGTGVVSTPSSSEDRIARETEITAEDLKKRYAGLQIYFRLSVNRNLDSGFTSDVTEEQAGVVSAFTSSYLETHDVCEAVERCLISSRKASHTTVEHLYRVRSRGLRSSHSLPPLSAFFVARKKPMDSIHAALRTPLPGSPAIALVIGLSGTGKTQISLKYAYDNDAQYNHILFIDASSAESIEKSLIARVQLIDSRLHPKNTKEALDLLVNPQGNLTRNWLIIMDNADDSKVLLQDFIPSCDHGCVLITSRNVSLSNINPTGHVVMDVMSREEAVEALLSAALGPKVSAMGEGPRMGQPLSIPRTEEDRECALKIVEELGRLPLAIIQAACYIKRHKCLREYPILLKTSRSRILRWPAKVQRDRLKYAHSTYAAFDTTLSALSPRALQLLGIISFVHFTDFPRPLLALAASIGFAYQPHDLLDRPPEYQQSIDLLQQVFLPKDLWYPIELDILLEELQTYSLVTLVPVSTIVTLRFHPLLHGWANDRLSTSDRKLFRAAAIRLLVCGTNPDDDYLWPYLSPHVEHFSLTSDELHVNDKAALAVVLKADGQTSKAFEVWKQIHAVVEVILGEKHVRTTQATLQLADAYGDKGHWGRMESMQRGVAEIRKETLGSRHPDTICANVKLARSWRARGDRIHQAAQLCTTNLRTRREILGPQHRDIVEALSELAATRMAQGSYEAAKILLSQALDMTTSLVGETHVATIRIMEQQASCYRHSGDKDEAIKLTRKVMRMWRTIRGEMHARTLEAMAKLATSYSEQGQHTEAEQMWRKIVDGRRNTLGDLHESTLKALFALGLSVQNQERFADAEPLWREVVAGWRKEYGERHNHTSIAEFWLARSVHGQKRYADAEELWKEVVSTWRSSLGDKHNDTLNALDWLGSSVQNQDRHADAEAILHEVVAGWRETIGKNHKDTIKSLLRLARSIHSQGRYADAEDKLSEVVAWWEQAPGGQCSDSLDAIFWLCCSVQNQERFGDAEPLWRELVTGRRRTLGNHHAETFQALYWLGRSVQSQERYADAEVFFKEAVVGLRDCSGSQHNETLDATFSLACSIHKQERFAEAEVLWREVVEGWRTTLGDQHEYTSNALQWLTRSIYEQGRYQDSEVLLREVVARWQTKLGPQHQNTLTGLFWLARSLSKQKRYVEAEVLWKEVVDGRRATLGEQHKHTLEAQKQLSRTQHAIATKNASSSNLEDKSHDDVQTPSSAYQSCASQRQDLAPQHKLCDPPLSKSSDGGDTRPSDFDILTTSSRPLPNLRRRVTMKRPMTGSGRPATN